MNNILQRTLAGSVFVFLVIASLWYGDISTVILFGIFTIFGLIEFYQLFNQHESVKVSWKFATAVGFLIFSILSASFMDWIPLIFIFFLIPILFLNMLIELWKKEDQPIYNIAIQMLGIVYIVFPFYLMVELNKQILSL